MEAFLAWLSQLDLDPLWNLLVTGMSCFLCISFHEMCHGLTAYALGDPTAKQAGRLTLNPLKHIDLMGLIMMLTVRFGWAKPVPVNMGYFKKPKAGMAVTALAGPVSNLILAAVALLLYAVAEFYYRLTGGPVLYYISLFFVYTASLSVGLAVFNLLPDRAYLKLMRYERYGSFLLMALLLLDILDGPLSMMREWVMDGLCAICLWPFDVLVSIYF